MNDPILELDPRKAGEDIVAANWENNQLRLEIRELSDLVERAIRNAYGGRTCKLWVAVMYAFGCGSGKAQAICTRYGYDPEQSLAETSRHYWGKAQATDY